MFLEIKSKLGSESHLEKVVIERFLGEAHSLGCNSEIEFDDSAILIDSSCILAPFIDDFHHLANISLLGSLPSLEY